MHVTHALRTNFGPLKLLEKSFLSPGRSFCKVFENDGHRRSVKAVDDALSKRQVSVPQDILLCQLLKCSTEKDLEAGKHVHQLMVSRGLGSNSFYCDHLIRFYESCGSLAAAVFVFYEAVRPTVYTWNAIISAHVNLGETEKALFFYSRMEQQGTQPGKVTYLYCLKACGSMQNLEYGRYIHRQILIGSLQIDATVGSALVCMYCKCENLEDAQTVFNGLTQHNPVLWGAMIAGYAKSSDAFLSLELFEKMQQQGMEPDQHIFSSVLTACGVTGMFCLGMIVHDNIIKNKLDIDCVIQNTFVCMYSKCGLLEEAHKMFSTLSKCDVISWGALLFGFVEQGEGLLALHFFHKINQSKTVKPSKAIFSCTLKACGIVKCILQGMLVHGQVLSENLENDVVVGNSLLDMYVKCTKLNDAYCVFCRLPQKDVVSWGTVISGFVQSGEGNIALKMIAKMQEQDIIPDETLLMCSLKACATECCTKIGHKIHDQIIRNCLAVSDTLYNALINMYSSCAFLDDAEKVFDYIKNKDVVSWSIMIDGCVQHEQEFRALTLFTKMQQSSIKADKFIHSCCLKACRGIGALGYGRWIHDQVVKNNLETDIVVAGTIADMYTFCGSMCEALNMLVRLPSQNEILWGAIIASCALRGNYAQAQEFLQHMLEQGLKPNEVVMTSVLAACSHAGLLKEGFNHFDLMYRLHGFASGKFEYSCMIDLLGRSGCSNQACDLMETMPMAPNAFSLASLLTGCRTYNDSASAKPCFDDFIELTPREASGYVMMSSVIAADRLSDCTKQCRKKRVKVER